MFELEHRIRFRYFRSFRDHICPSEALNIQCSTTVVAVDAAAAAATSSLQTLSVLFFSISSMTSAWRSHDTTIHACLVRCATQNFLDHKIFGCSNGFPNTHPHPLFVRSSNSSLLCRLHHFWLSLVLIASTDYHENASNSKRFCS